MERTLDPVALTPSGCPVFKLCGLFLSTAGTKRLILAVLVAYHPETPRNHSGKESLKHSRSHLLMGTRLGKPRGSPAHHLQRAETSSTQAPASPARRVSPAHRKNLNSGRSCLIFHPRPNTSTKRRRLRVPGSTATAANQRPRSWRRWQLAAQ